MVYTDSIPVSTAADGADSDNSAFDSRSTDEPEEEIAELCTHIEAGGCAGAPGRGGTGQRPGSNGARGTLSGNDSRGCRCFGRPIRRRLF